MDRADVTAGVPAAGGPAPALRLEAGGCRLARRQHGFPSRCETRPGRQRRSHSGWQGERKKLEAARMGREGGPGSGGPVPASRQTRKDSKQIGELEVSPTRILSLTRIQFIIVLFWFDDYVRCPEDLKLNNAAIRQSLTFLKLPNPNAKCVPQCRAAGGGPSTLHPCFLHYKLIVQVTS